MTTSVVAQELHEREVESCKRNKKDFFAVDDGTNHVKEKKDLFAVDDGTNRYHVSDIVLRVVQSG